MEFSIDPSSRLPICRQLSHQIREAVARGNSSPTSGSPRSASFRGRWWSIRTRSPGCTPSWSGEGILNTRPGLGVFVARPGSELSRKVRKERLQEAARPLFDRGRPPGLHRRRGCGAGREQVSNSNGRQAIPVVTYEAEDDPNLESHGVL